MSTENNINQLYENCIKILSDLIAINTDCKTSYKPILGLSTDRYAK